MKPTITDAEVRQAIESDPFASHESLASSLNVSQSTISRRLKRMGYARTRSGRLKSYDEADAPPYRPKRYAAATEYVLSIDLVDRFAIVHTSDGAAQLVGAFVDSLKLNWVAGSIGGHNTLLVILRGDLPEISRRYLPLLRERLTEV